MDDNADTSQVHHRDLRAALDAVLAGRPVAQPKTVAFGCIIRRPAAQVASSQITYARDVAPILQRQCETCHRAGQIGPMALTSYAQAAAWRGDIKRYTQSRQMPPWKADPGAGDFQDARRLSDHEIATLAKWADAGAPEGDPKDLPAPAAFHTTAGRWASRTWSCSRTAPYHVDADGPDVYRCYVIPTDFTQDRYVSAVDVQPGNRAVVHHVIAFIDGDGASANLDGHEKEPGYTSFGGVGFTPTGALGGWAPGITAHYLPAGVATQVPAGARIVLQVHYHKDGKPETDLSRVGLYFAKGPVEQDPARHPGHPRPANPAGRRALHGHHDFGVPSPVDLSSDRHHAAHAPAGPRDEADGDSARRHESPAGLGLRLGLQLAVHLLLQEAACPARRARASTMTATYDNSAHNPRNPNSPPETRDLGRADDRRDVHRVPALHAGPGASGRPGPSGGAGGAKIALYVERARLAVPSSFFA